MLYPITPHICFELWHKLGHETNIDNESWPVVDNSALVETEKLIVIQVNGKVRGKVNVNVDATKDQIFELAQKDESVAKFMAGHEIKKVIYVPGKLLNIVVG